MRKNIVSSSFTLELKPGGIIIAHNSNACMQFQIDFEASSRGMIKFGEEGLKGISDKNINRLREIITNAGNNNTHCSITGEINLQKSRITFSEMRIEE